MLAKFSLITEKRLKLVSHAGMGAVRPFDIEATVYCNMIYVLHDVMWEEHISLSSVPFWFLF